MLRKVLGIILVTLLVGLVFLGYRFDWTGFKGRSLWDWMELILIPVLLFLLARYFIETTENREKLRQDTQKQIEKAKLLDEEQSKILQDYFDRMQTLLLDKDLYNAQEGSQVSNLARSITLLTLKRLTPEHKATVITFLSTAELIQIKSNGRRISLCGADLQGIGSPLGFFQMNFNGADLQGADLRDAKLDIPDFQGADLRMAVLENANLIGADFRGANLETALLKNCNLYEAIFDDNTTLPNGDRWTKTTKITDWGAVELAPFTDEEIEQTHRELRIGADDEEESNNTITHSSQKPRQQITDNK